jgi:hypothetical protein
LMADGTGHFTSFAYHPCGAKRRQRWRGAQKSL